MPKIKENRVRERLCRTYIAIYALVLACQIRTHIVQGKPIKEVLGTIDGGKERGWFTADQVVALMDKVLRWMPLPLNCLSRSLVLAKVLGRFASDRPHCEIVVGVQNNPFGGHAWVEVAGSPVLSDVNVAPRYKPVIRKNI